MLIAITGRTRVNAVLLTLDILANRLIVRNFLPRLWQAITCRVSIGFMLGTRRSRLTDVAPTLTSFVVASFAALVGLFVGVGCRLTWTRLLLINICVRPRLAALILGSVFLVVLSVLRICEFLGRANMVGRWIPLIILIIIRDRVEIDGSGSVVMVDVSGIVVTDVSVIGLVDRL